MNPLHVRTALAPTAGWAGHAQERARPVAPQLLTGWFGPWVPSAGPASWAPDGAPPGYLTRIRIDKVGGIGPWAA